MKTGNWAEFDKIEAGEIFDQSIIEYKNMAIGDIVFYYRTDSNRGIHFIAEIFSDSYRADYNTKYARDMRILKRIDSPYDNMAKNGFEDLEERIKKLGQGGQKYHFKAEDNGAELYAKLMLDSQIPDSVDDIISKKDYKEISNIKDSNIRIGTRFNPFNQLNIIKGEVKHFGFLGNLLNPSGTHFQQTLFLKHFCSELLEVLIHDSIRSESKETPVQEKIKTFIDKNPQVFLEKNILGDINRGRIDLWLESDDFIIAIEGKIESKDNKGQLKKYHEYLEKQEKEFVLIYLTPKGDEPENIDSKTLSNFHKMNFRSIIDLTVKSMNDIDAENFLGVYETLYFYQDALKAYLYKHHLSTQFGLDLIEEITSSQKKFEKYEKIKEIYYRNRPKYHLTPVEDIAFVFEYAKAYIEYKFYLELLTISDESNDDDDYERLEINDSGKHIDIYRIANARKRRLNPTINNDQIDLGKIDLDFSINHKKCHLTNSAEGLKLKVDTKNITVIHREVFLSRNIGKLLNKRYMQKQISLVVNAV